MYFKKQSFIFIIVATILTVICLIYYLYDDNGQIITIYPDLEPAKIKPQNAGGMILSNSESSIYENLQSQRKNAKKIIIQSEPEEPVSIIQKKLDQEPTDNLDDIFKNISSIELSSDSNDLDIFTLPNVTSPTDILEQPEQKKGLNIIKVNEKDNKLGTINGSSKTLYYRIQLGAVKSEPQAVAEWTRIKKKNPKIFANKTMILKKISYDNGKFFYLILEGNYSNINQAKVTCKKLLSAEQNCIVTKHSE